MANIPKIQIIYYYYILNGSINRTDFNLAVIQTSPKCQDTQCKKNCGTKKK